MDGLQFVLQVAEYAKRREAARPPLPYSDPRRHLMSCLAWYAETCGRFQEVKELLGNFVKDATLADTVRSKCAYGSGFGFFHENIATFPPGGPDVARLKTFADHVSLTFSRKLQVVMNVDVNILYVTDTKGRELNPEFEAYICRQYLDSYDIIIYPFRPYCEEMIKNKDDVTVMQEIASQMLVMMNRIETLPDIPTFWKENVKVWALLHPDWKSQVVKYFECK